MPDSLDRQMSEEHRLSRQKTHARSKIFPLPGEFPGETPKEFAAGMGACCGDLMLALGPDGDLYYTTFAGDGQVHKIVFSEQPDSQR